MKKRKHLTRAKIPPILSSAFSVSALTFQSISQLCFDSVFPVTWHSSNIRFYFLGRLPCARPRPFDFILTLINLSQFTHFSCWACPNGPKGDQPDRDLCSCLFSLFFSQQFDTRVSRKDRTIHDVSRLCALSLILSTLLDIVVVADVILEFRQNELAPVFQYTRLDLYTHHFGVYIGYIHGGILRSLNSVELH